MGQRAESSMILCLEEVCQLDVGQLQCLVEFIRMRHRVQSLLSMIALFTDCSEF